MQNYFFVLWLTSHCLCLLSYRKSLSLRRKKQNSYARHNKESLLENWRIPQRMVAVYGGSDQKASWTHHVGYYIGNWILVFLFPDIYFYADTGVLCLQVLGFCKSGSSKI